jgi:competence protein ComEA
MSLFFRLPLTLLAVAIAGPVLAADPATNNAAAAPGAVAPAPAMPAKPAAMPQASAPQAAIVDINRASAADLKTLPGVTEAEAAKIVRGRPYKEPGDLVARKILPESVYHRIKDRVTAGQARS